jgi:hypothetical protein
MERTVLFVLVQPLGASLHEEFVLAEAGIDESIDKTGSQILPGRVDLSAAERRPHVLQVRFVYVLWYFGFHDVKLLRVQLFRTDPSIEIEKITSLARLRK